MLILLLYVLIALLIGGLIYKVALALFGPTVALGVLILLAILALIWLVGAVDGGCIDHPRRC